MGIETTKKLAYLAETKDLIKAALIEKGQEVSDTDTFRSYADKVLAIETGGGSVEGVHYVTFMSQDGTTELYKRPVADGDDCADPVTRGYIPAPTKESTAQYDYHFVGWATTPNGAWDENALKTVTKDKTVYVAFASALRLYTITFYDDDGTTVLDTQSVAYGSIPSYTPTKLAHTFDGWVPELKAVTGDASYTATWVTGTVVASGDFSSGTASWRLFDTGDFIVFGTGATDSYSTAAPWYTDHRSKIKNVVIQDGITSIGAYNFYQCTNLVSMTIGKDVAEFKLAAVRGCSNLTSAIFEDPTTWYNTTSATATTGGTLMTMTNPTTAANNIKNNNYIRRFYKK